MGDTNSPHPRFATGMGKKIYNRDKNGVGVARPIPAPLPSLFKEIISSVTKIVVDSSILSTLPLFKDFFFPLFSVKAQK